MLRIFSADGFHDDAPSVYWSLSQFFNWYRRESLRIRAKRKPSEATLDRRYSAIAWWSRLMGTPQRPDGPLISEIDEAALDEFAEKLKTAKYRRGRTGRLRTLAVVTQHRTLDELQIVLSALGPPDRRRVRANLLTEVPVVLYDDHTPAPKSTWTIDEARKVYAAASASCHRILARATVALWYYTGCRARCYESLSWDDVTAAKVSVSETKTSKRKHLQPPEELREAIEACRGLDSNRVLPWPVQYRRLFEIHQDHWQRDLPVDRRLSPQAWRRLHATTCASLGLDAAQQAASDSLMHSSREITEAHYVSTHNLILQRFPRLEP